MPRTLSCTDSSNPPSPKISGPSTRDAPHLPAAWGHPLRRWRFLPLRGFFRTSCCRILFLQKVKIQKLIGPQHEAEAQIDVAVVRVDAAAIGNPQVLRKIEPATAAPHAVGPA